MENPSVLFVGHTAELSGGEIALLRLTKALKERQRVSPQILLFSQGPLVQSLQEACIPTYVVALDPSIITLEKDKTHLKYIFKSNTLAKTFVDVIRLARFIRAQNPTLVHTNSLKADSLPEWQRAL